MAEKISVMLVDPYADVEDFLQMKEIEPTLESYYKLIDCSTIDMPSYTIGGKRYVIVCDDEGLFKEDIRPAAISSDSQVCLVGRLIITNDSGKGTEKSLEREDFVRISKALRIGTDPRKGTLFPCLAIGY